MAKDKFPITDEDREQAAAASERAAAKAKADAEARELRLNEALTNKPAREKKPFRVSHEDKSAVILADNENDARAIFNDGNQKWPSPRMVKVEAVAA